MFKKENTKIIMKKRMADTAAKMLEEEGLTLDEDTIFDALMYKYGSTNKNHAFQLMLLYAGKLDLRNTAGAVAEQYYDHKHPEIDNLVGFIEWLENHLEGISFAKEYDPMQSGDYNPKEPAHWLDGMYTLMQSYQREGEMIDSMRQIPVLEEYFNGVPEGEGGESKIITSHELYNLYRGGWFKEQAVAIERELNSPDITPSKALSMLRENWELYTSSTSFRNMNRCIEYCIYCAADFPDTPEARKAFRHVVQAIHLPSEK